MSRSKRELTAEERSLWQRVAATLKDERKRVSAKSAPSQAIVASHPPAGRPTQPVVRAQPKSVHPPDRGAEKRVRRGRLEVDAVLDLHGHTRESARLALKRFLTAARKRHHRVVTVVTGAGRGGEGVLRRSLPEWLADSDIQPLTSGYAQAHRSHGGAGAFYVFIKRVRTNS